MSLWWPMSRAALPPAPPTVVEVLQDEIRFLRKLHAEITLANEKLREEVLTLSSSRARQEIEYFRHIKAKGEDPDRTLTPEEALHAAHEASRGYTPGEGLVHGGSLVADGHVPMHMSPEQEREEREAQAREDERLRQAVVEEDGGG